MLRLEKGPVLLFRVGSDLGLWISDFLSDHRNHSLLAPIPVPPP